MYVLKKKDQACDTFVKFKAEAENSVRLRIKTVRSNKGGVLVDGIQGGV